MIKNYITYIIENVEIDPYGEEIWDENWNDTDLKIGDKVECINNIHTQLKIGKIYTIKYIPMKGILDGYFFLKDAPDSELAYRIKRFRKIN